MPYQNKWAAELEDKEVHKLNVETTWKGESQIETKGNQWRVDKTKIRCVDVIVTPLAHSTHVFDTVS